MPFLADPALTGDLLEELRQGRSPAWYWRQVIAAFLSHSLPALRAIGITWLVNWLAVRLGNQLLIQAYRRQMHSLWLHPGVASFVVLFFAGMTSGTVVGFRYRRNRSAMLRVCGMSLLIWSLLTVGFLKNWRSATLLQVAGGTIVVYGVALAGFLTGGWLFPLRAERRAVD